MIDLGLMIGQIRQDPDKRLVEAGFPPRKVRVLALGVEHVSWARWDGKKARVQNLNTGRVTHINESALAKWPLLENA